jgi:ribonuclease J
VLTHGHEDHLGAVPYLLRERADIPIVGSTFTLALLEAKLREHRIKPVLRPVKEEQVEQYGPFSLEFFAVNHSIPDALAVAIKTEAGIVLHTGDFKMDQLPMDGRLTDLGGFARLGREGIDLLLSDSTNAEQPGFVTSEREIAPVIDDVVRTSSGASSSPASPATCTACRPSSTPRSATGATSCSSAARWSATWAWPATSATCASRRA